MRFLWLVLFLIPFQSFAKVSIVSISGASAVDSGATVPIVYGGTAGLTTDGNCASSGTDVCNNCDGDAPAVKACNRARITSSTLVRIEFKSDGENAQTGYAMIGSDSTGATVGTKSSTITSQGSSAVITLDWESICDQMDSGQTACETKSGGVDPLNSAVILRVGIDSSTTPDDKMDGTNDDYIRVSFKVQRSIAGEVNPAVVGSSADGTNGIVEWNVFPGDQKVYLENLYKDPGFPSSANGILYKYLHLFYEPITGARDCATHYDTVLNNSPSVRVGIKTDGNLEDDRFRDGSFENEVDYVFKVAIEDQAGNIGLFFPESACLEDSHFAKPGEVFGLLKDQNNCFIATAAYGSPLSESVKTFRNFRDRFLTTTTWGRKFVTFYYDHSPRFAKMISESQVLRAGTQVALAPLWAFSALSLVIGFWPTAVITICFGLSLMILFNWTIRKRMIKE